jgi:hypothetical protein
MDQFLTPLSALLEAWFAPWWGPRADHRAFGSVTWGDRGASVFLQCSCSFANGVAVMLVPVESLWVVKTRYAHEKRRGKLGPKLGPNNIFRGDQVPHSATRAVENP